MAHVIANHGRPTLVMSHNKTLAAQLYGELKALLPTNAVEYFISYHEAREELEEAERDLERFRERNRSIANSPQLTFELGRLQRRVDLRQQVYVSLASAYEQARINEVRNTPVPTIIESPEGWSSRRGMDLLRAVAVAGFLGVITAASLALAMHYVQVERENHPEEVRRFQAIRRSLPALRR